ncbi:TrkA family potassium uptake protein [Candidatus Bipolaricaulota bacterium]|nr:TrkA family potassium uptake protein [Candidatus Bipolaricaulota bacterium]
MYMIIVGAGSIGTSLIDISVAEKNNVVVVDANADRAREISTKYDITVLSGDATSADTLREAGSERADAVIVTTSDDAVNLMVVSIAADLGIPSIVSVVNDAEHADFFRRLGANVMENPEDVVAHHLYNAVKRPNVQDFAMLTQGAQIFRLRVSEGSPLIDRSVEEAIAREILPDSVLIVAIERDGEQTMSIDDLTILSDDVLTLFTLDRVGDELVEKLSG